MGLGSTAKKLQRVVDIADELYEKLNDLTTELTTLHDSIEETNDRVASLEDELQRQRSVLEAIAEEEGIDVEAVTESSE
ncbi:MAG: DUF5798 family protein [Halodesulfurarchaeum sp.]